VISSKNANREARAPAHDHSTQRAKGNRPFEAPLTVSRPELVDAGGRSDRSFRQLVYDLSVAGTQLEVARAYLASQLNVSSPRYNIIMVVAQYQGTKGVSVSEVARHLHVTTAHVGFEVKTLELEGWVERIVNPDDRRSTLLKITRDSEQRVSGLGDELRFVNDHLFRNVTAEDFAALSRLVAQIVDDFSETIALLEAKQAKRKRAKVRLGED